MPYTEEFNKIRRKYAIQYNDRAKAETFAFQQALITKTPTYCNRINRFKFQQVKKGNVFAGLLYWLMALIIVALFLPAFLPILNISSVSNVCSDINGKVICLIIQFFPVVLVVMLLIIFFIIMRGNQ